LETKRRDQLKSQHEQGYVIPCNYISLKTGYEIKLKKYIFGSELNGSFASKKMSRQTLEISLNNFTIQPKILLTIALE